MKFFRVALLIVIFFTGLSRIILGVLPATAADIDSASLMAKINQERGNRNIPALIISPKLSVAAGAKTTDMLSRGYFDHVDPDGKFVWFRIEAAGYKPYKTLGENLAIDFSTENGIVNAWINSPSHRDNLLNSGFEDQGLSAQYGDYQTRYTSIVTSLFGTLVAKPAVAQVPRTSAPPASHPSSPTPKPTPPPAQPVAQPTVANEAQKPLENENRSEPAITLSTVTDAPASNGASTTPVFATYIPSNFTSVETDAYASLRWVFIFLVLIFILTFFIDIFRRDKLREALTKTHQLPVLLLVALVCLLSAGLY